MSFFSTNFNSNEISFIFFIGRLIINFSELFSSFNSDFPSSIKGFNSSKISSNELYIEI